MFSSQRTRVKYNEFGKHRFTFFHFLFLHLCYFSIFHSFILFRYFIENFFYFFNSSFLLFLYLYYFCIFFCIFNLYFYLSFRLYFYLFKNKIFRRFFFYEPFFWVSYNFFKCKFRGTGILNYRDNCPSSTLDVMEYIYIWIVYPAKYHINSGLSRCYRQLYGTQFRRLYSSPSHNEMIGTAIYFVLTRNIEINPDDDFNV